MDRIPKSGEFYRHFKDKLYQVITVAEHTETGEPLVIYQALYGDYRTYARPLAMFISEVDRVKYPDEVQKYRFEKVELSNNPVAGGEVSSVSEKKLLNPRLLTFIEAETYEKRMESLIAMRGRLGQEELELIYVALDMKRPEGSVEEQFCAVEQNLKMQKHYDGGRLR